ncbi:WUSCHEL-related homeobox 11 [Zea mays]|uniref:WUSCHEL-related homeobox 11 n=1 Tax=Zea mays TaxID=4577 RepID=A0A1D6K190_MAIZE|nr:WUSCHEL-related homeobox 11 [Zea mays]
MKQFSKCNMSLGLNINTHVLNIICIRLLKLTTFSFLPFGLLNPPSMRPCMDLKLLSSTIQPCI